MSWTPSEHAIIKSIQRDVGLLLNVIRGNLDRPEEPGMVETLRAVEGQVKADRAQVITNELNHETARSRFKKMLAGVGLMAFIALVMQWKYAAGLVVGLLELAIKWVT